MKKERINEKVILTWHINNGKVVSSFKVAALLDGWMDGREDVFKVFQLITGRDRST